MTGCGLQWGGASADKSPRPLDVSLEYWGVYKLTGSGFGGLFVCENTDGPHTLDAQIYTDMWKMK